MSQHPNTQAVRIQTTRTNEKNIAPRFFSHPAFALKMQRK